MHDQLGRTVNGPMAKGAQTGEAEGARSERVLEMVAYQSCGDARSVARTREGSRRGDGLIRGSFFGRLLLRAWSCALVEKGEAWNVDCVCLIKGLAKRMAELCRGLSGIWRAVARDLRTGESFILM